MSSEEGKDRSKELKHTVQNNYKGKCSYFKYVHTLQYMVHAVLHTYTPCYMYTMPIPNTALHSGWTYKSPIHSTIGLSPHRTVNVWMFSTYSNSMEHGIITLTGWT